MNQTLNYQGSDVYNNNNSRSPTLQYSLPPLPPPGIQPSPIPITPFSPVGTQRQQLDQRSQQRQQVMNQMREQQLEDNLRSQALPMACSWEEQTIRFTPQEANRYVNNPYSRTQNGLPSHTPTSYNSYRGRGRDGRGRGRGRGRGQR